MLKKNLYYLVVGILIAYYLVVGILIAMVSVDKASTNAVGEWKLKEVWKENGAGLLPIHSKSYVLKVWQEYDSRTNSNELILSTKIGNSMMASVEIVKEDENSHQQTIKIGPVAIITKIGVLGEIGQLERYFYDQLPKMVSMEVRGGEEQDKLLVLSNEAGAKIVCEFLGRQARLKPTLG